MTTTTYQGTSKDAWSVLFDNRKYKNLYKQGYRLEAIDEQQKPKVTELENKFKQFATDRLNEIEQRCNEIEKESQKDSVKDPQTEIIKRQNLEARLSFYSDSEIVDYINSKDVTNTDIYELSLLQQKYDNAFLLRTFSKAYGLAGLRVGYVVASEHAIEKWNIIRPPFNVTRISEYAAVAALEDQQYLKEVTHKNSVERERFYQLPQSKHFLPSQTNFIFVKTKRVNELYEALLNVGCITRPFPTGVRITIGFKEQNDKMLEVLSNFKYE